MPDPKLIFLKFDSQTCGPCHAMNKKGVLKDLAQSYKNITLIDLTITNEDSEAPPGTSFSDAYDLSEEDAFDVQSTPTTIVLTEEGFEVARVTDPIMRLSDGEKLYAAAVKAAEEIEEERKLRARVTAFVAKWSTPTPK